MSKNVNVKKKSRAIFENTRANKNYNVMKHPTCPRKTIQFEFELSKLVCSNLYILFHHANA